MVNIVSMATGKTLTTHLFEVGKSKYLVQMFLGRITVAKEIFYPNIYFVRLETREFLSFFFVAMLTIFTIAMITETVLAANSYCPGRSLKENNSLSYL